MPKKPQRAKKLAWLIEPPRPGTVHVHIEFAEGAKVTPEVQEAIDRLMRQLQPQEQDVSGFGACPTKAVELPPPPKCSPRTVHPCAVKSVDCHIIYK